MTDEQWTPVPTWKDEQPYRCTLCNDTFAGRELGYMPSMCERDGCDGGPGRPDPVVVVPVSSVVPIARLAVEAAARAAGRVRNARGAPRFTPLDEEIAHAALAAALPLIEHEVRVSLTRLREWAETRRAAVALRPDDDARRAYNRMLDDLSALLDDVECASNPNNERTNDA